MTPQHVLALPHLIQCSAKVQNQRRKAYQFVHDKNMLDVLVNRFVCLFVYLTSATSARYNQNIPSIKNNHSKQGGTDFLFLQNISSLIILLGTISHMQDSHSMSYNRPNYLEDNIFNIKTRPLSTGIQLHIFIMDTNVQHI